MSNKSSHSRRLFASTVAGLLILWATMSWAQDQFDVQQFHPMPSQQTNYFGLASARVLAHTDFDVGLMLNYADDPLVLVYGDDDERLASIVGGQLTADVMGAIGLLDWFELGFAVPLVLLQEGDETNIVPDAPDAGFGLGDIRVVPRFLLFSTESRSEPGGFSLGFMSNFWIPLGDQESYQGEGFRFEPRLVLDAAFGRVVRLSLNAGYYYRDDTDFLNLEVDDTITAGLAANIAITDMIQLVPEVGADIPVLADDMDLEEIPVEGLLGVKLYPIEGLLVELGGGTGLVEGFSAPDWRVFLGLSYSPVEAADRDGDGYLNEEDSCPDDPEDFDEFEDEDGCPDPDNDSDGVLDADDACPLQPEDGDGFEDRDGCPDPDNDGDGILDVDDECPDDAEDFDEFEDEDGCPDPDNDSDGLLDDDDECPNEPETFNDYQDEDGCPDVALIECDRIELAETVYFDTDSDVIQARSFDMLDDVAELFSSRTDIRLVRVEGHTDSRASDEYNLDLSQRRAESVMRYLVERGVQADRLRPVGYGEGHPVATNSTEEGRAQNRRVEFIILEQDGCEDIHPPY